MDIRFNFYYPFLWHGLYVYKQIEFRRECSREVRNFYKKEGTPMAKSSGNRSSGNRGSKGGNRTGSKGRGSAGWPSKNSGKPSGGGRKNAPFKGKGK